MRRIGADMKMHSSRGYWQSLRINFEYRRFVFYCELNSVEKSRSEIIIKFI
jgi:hypothetical protein